MVKVGVIEREQMGMKKKSYMINLHMSRKELWVDHWHIKVMNQINAY